MGCDFYVITYLTGFGMGPQPDSDTATTHQSPAPIHICVQCSREPQYDYSYDSDSEGDLERQRQRRVPQPKVLMADGVWQISSQDKREFYERLVKEEHPEIATITHLEKTYEIGQRH